MKNCKMIAIVVAALLASVGDARARGHRNINSTLIYTHLINFEDDEFHVKVARTLKEACNLIEAGFDYVTDMDEAKIFRKRK